VLSGPFEKLFADRGPHLAAMIAYFALLSFVPLLFLALALLGLAGRADESSLLVTELGRIFPSTSITSIVRAVTAIQDNAAALGIVGGFFLLWTSLSLFSALESALNIVYRQPNRPFLHGKAVAVALTSASLVVLFAGLVAGSLGVALLTRWAPGAIGSDAAAYTASAAVSLLAALLFLVAVYRFLTNVEIHVVDVLPGAIVAAILLEVSFQVLPVYLRLFRDFPAAQAFGGPVLLLVWLYLMANVIVFGAEINWWRHRDRPAPATEDGVGLA
jgi:membrane protein